MVSLRELHTRFLCFAIFFLEPKKKNKDIDFDESSCLRRRFELNSSKKGSSSVNGMRKLEGNQSLLKVFWNEIWIPNFVAKWLSLPNSLSKSLIGFQDSNGSSQNNSCHDCLIQCFEWHHQWNRIIIEFESGSLHLHSLIECLFT